MLAVVFTLIGTVVFKLRAMIKAEEARVAARERVGSHSHAN